MDSNIDYPHKEEEVSSAKGKAGQPSGEMTPSW